MRITDDKGVPFFRATTKYQFDIPSDTGFPIQTVAEGVCNIIDTHTRFQFLEVYLVICHILL